MSQDPPPPPYGEQSPYGGQSPYGQQPPYGAPPPPPPYGQGPWHPAMGPSRYSAGDAISYGWAKFKAEPGPLLVGALLALLVSFVVSLIGEAILAALFGVSMAMTPFSERGANVGFVGLMSTNVLLGLVSQVVSTIAMAGFVKAALLTTDGRPVTFEECFRGWDKLQLVLAAVLVSVATTIGMFLLVIPGLIVAFLTAFTTVFIVDRNLGAVDAIRASVQFTADHVGDVLVFGLLALVVLVIGLCLCGVGLFVAAPVTAVGAAYTYRVLEGQPVSPVVR